MIRSDEEEAERRVFAAMRRADAAWQAALAGADKRRLAALDASEQALVAATRACEAWCVAVAAQRTAQHLEAVADAEDRAADKEWKEATRGAPANK